MADLPLDQSVRNLEWRLYSEGPRGGQQGRFSDVNLLRLLRRWGSVVVHEVHGGDWQLGGVEPGPAVAGVAVDGRLQIELTDTLEDADEERIDGD